MYNYNVFRGHGIAVVNTTDGRVFINNTVLENNYGDGVYYQQKAHELFLMSKYRKFFIYA